MKKYMLRIWMGLLVVGSLVLWSAPVHAEGNLEVKIETGKIMGKLNQDTLEWWGVPYGAAPSGKLRWKKPVKPTAWTGVRDYTKPKKRASGLNENTEDCLYVNVFRPNTSEEKLPVLVYLHGGGNSGGTANRNFDTLSKATNSVIISVEFRQGAFGWFAVPALRTGDAEEDSGNFAMLDLRLALQWVQRNVSRFGGNPKNVTIAGFSAGGRDVMLCVISPIMKGLFHKAIVFSGGMVTAGKKTGEKSSLDKLADIFVKKGKFSTKKEALTWLKKGNRKKIRAALYALSTKEIQKIYSATGMRMSEFPQCFRDGKVIPKSGFRVIKKGKYNRVPIILGSSTSEFSKYSYWLDDSVSILANQYGSKMQAYSYVEEPVSYFLKDKKHKNIYAFRFSWGEDPKVTSPYVAKEVGADHGSPVNFLMQAYQCRYSYLQKEMYHKSNEKGRLVLSHKMQKYVAKFMRSGKPGGKWKKWTKKKKKKLIRFTASKKKAKIKMTGKTINLKKVIEDFRKIPSDKFELLVNDALGDRFFTPKELRLKGK